MTEERLERAFDQIQRTVLRHLMVFTGTARSRNLSTAMQMPNGESVAGLVLAAVTVQWGQNYATSSMFRQEQALCVNFHSDGVPAEHQDFANAKVAGRF